MATHIPTMVLWENLNAPRKSEKQKCEEMKKVKDNFMQAKLFGPRCQLAACNLEKMCSLNFNGTGTFSNNLVTGSAISFIYCNRKIIKEDKNRCLVCSIFPECRE